MIKLVKSSFYHEEETKRALADFILAQDIFSMGPECRQFEQAFAKKQERRHAVFVHNGSVANLLLIQALLNEGLLKKGDRVGFSALTWPTNVMPLIQLGLEPVALDCSLDTLNVSPATLEPHIDNLQGVFLTNVLGFCDDVNGIGELCRQRGVVLVEDNCEALGSRAQGGLLGNFGRAATFSFFVGHHLSTIEGGMVVTDDDDLHAQLVMARSHGWDRNLAPDKQQQLRADHAIDDFYAKYTFYDLASNFRPTEINGFIGNLQLPYWDEIVGKREQNYRRVAGTMDAIASIRPLELAHMETISSFAIPVICRTKDAMEQYLAAFQKADVEIRPMIAGNMLNQPFYKKHVTDVQECANADLIHDQGFYFGNNPELTDAELTTLEELLG